MSTKQNYKEASRSIFMSSMMGFANVAAAVATFFSVQPVFNMTQGWVAEFTTTHYGSDWIEPVSWFWWLAIVATLFFTARASIATVIVIGAFAFATRFL